MMLTKYFYVDFSWLLNFYSKFGSFEENGLYVGTLSLDTFSIGLDRNSGHFGSVGAFGNWALCDIGLRADHKSYFIVCLEVFIMPFVWFK